MPDSSVWAVYGRLHPTRGFRRAEDLPQIPRKLRRVCLTAFDFSYFRPFSCKTFHLCPSCDQKRTILYAEYLAEELLLELPHRQFVFTVLKILRPYFKKDKRLSGFFSLVARRELQCACVASYQSFGEFARFHPHWHVLVLEVGFDQWGFRNDTSPRNARLLGPASQEELGPPAEKSLRGRPAPLPKLRRNHGGGRNHRMGRWATVSPTRGSRTAHSPGLNRRFCFPFWIENSRCSRPKCPRHGVP